MTETDAPRLLIVDDEVGILTALRRTLRGEGYQLFVAESGAEGLRLLEGQPVDLILSDQKMPGMGGVEFCDLASSLCPGVPKVLITGWSKGIPQEKLDALGVVALVPKPWDAVDLKHTLREALAESPRFAGGGTS